METVECEKIKEWNGKPIYRIGISDGRTGESFQQIPVGTKASELVFEDKGKYGISIKWNKPNQGGGFNGGGRPKSGNESFALAYAKDYAVAVIGAGKEFKGAQVLDLAELFYNWMETKKK